LSGFETDTPAIVTAPAFAFPTMRPPEGQMGARRLPAVGSAPPWSCRYGQKVTNMGRPRHEHTLITADTTYI
jgi:hypothetical protein